MDFWDLLADWMPARITWALAGYPGTGLKSIYLKSIGRRINFRAGTTDLACVKKVLLCREYAIPFDINPRVIIDGGANIGAASLFFAHAYPEANILALEPEDSNFDLLVKNCAGIGNIIPVHAALWSESRALALADKTADKWSFSVTAKNTSQDADVAGISMADLIARHGIKTIDILKLDIEGAERELFSAEDTEWLDKVGVIAIELHDRFKPGCAKALYGALHGKMFHQEMRGENIFIRLND